MLVSITCSVLVHLTAFAYSYNWTFTTDKVNQLFVVDLIDAPVRLEEKQSGNQETLDGRLGRQVVMNEQGSAAKGKTRPAIYRQQAISPSRRHGMKGRLPLPTIRQRQPSHWTVRM